MEAHSPIHLVVTDPRGRKEGYDPIRNTTWNEIPDAAYISENISNPDGTTSPETKLLYIPDPIYGTYQTEVIGYDTGNYEVDIVKTTSSETTQETYSGIASPSSEDQLSTLFIPYSIYLPLTRK